MRVFLLGAPCAGKTTLMTPLRALLSCPVLDMDDEIRTLNGGTWPRIEAKRGLARRVIERASHSDDGVLAYSLLDQQQLALLNAHGWVVCLLDVPEAILRGRAERRLHSEGWTNIEWLPLHLRVIDDLLARGAFAHVLDATMPVPALAATIMAILEGGAEG